jgi:predicted nucleic-acid-binding protein
MIGLDTNVLLSYILQDDAKQAAKASTLIESLTAAEAGYITLVCVVELVWVLESSYGLTREQVSQALEGLLRSKQLVVEQADQVLGALRVFKLSKADFADCLIERSAAHAGCIRTMTFDAGAVKHAGMVLIS